MRKVSLAGYLAVGESKKSLLKALLEVFASKFSGVPSLRL